MAAVLFKAHLARSGYSAGWRIESAGTWAEQGQPVLAEAQQVMRERGLSLNGHRARMVSADLLSGFDLILTMQQSHKEALTVEFPRVASRVWLVSEMSGGDWDVRDPLPPTIEEMRRAAHTIDEALAKGMARIRALTGIPRNRTQVL